MLTQVDKLLGLFLKCALNFHSLNLKSLRIWEKCAQFVRSLVDFTTKFLGYNITQYRRSDCSYKSYSLFLSKFLLDEWINEEKVKRCQNVFYYTHNHLDV